METGETDAEGGRAFQLLREAGGGALPFGVVGGRGVEHVRGMRDDMLGGDAGLGERRAEAGDALGANGAAVAVVLRDRGENLERGHARAAGAEDGHVDAAGIDRVGAEVVDVGGQGTSRCGRWSGSGPALVTSSTDGTRPATHSEGPFPFLETFHAITTRYDDRRQ